MKKIILDTDIGSDIDDCFALAYLLSSEDIEILGITTVSGLPELRAQLADKVCHTYGVDIPIHVGNEKSFANDIRQPTLTKAQTRVANSNERKFLKDNTAIEFMKSMIEKHPNEITLVCIGQLTNIAMLFLKYPHLSKLLAGLVIMGGRYSENELCDIEKWGKTEWNILCDIDAAKIVFNQEVKNCVVMGVEQTCRFCMPPIEFKQILSQNERLSAVCDSISTTVEAVYFHDVVTIYAWLFPEEVTVCLGDIEIDDSNSDDCAKTIFSPSNEGKHLVVTDFYPDRFFNNYLKTVLS